MKILPILLLLLVTIGCQRPVQRFVPMNDNTALDTKTGRRCNPDPAQPTDRSPDSLLPLCYDLYKAEK
jgi:hypothetical protein